MSQRQILENSIQLFKTLRGPAKILYANGTLGFPTTILQVIDPTGGAPASGWTPFGLTRGGVNVSKTIDAQVRDDLDQIMGAYDQDITDRSYAITTQLAEVLDPALQLGMALDMYPTATYHASGGATYSRRPLDDSNNKFADLRLAVVYPKGEDGKVLAFVFRRAQLQGGEKALRFDKSDPMSPPLEFRAFPELATTINPEDAYGAMFEIV
jgi:hypothetical protein